MYPKPNVLFVSHSSGWGGSEKILHYLVSHFQTEHTVGIALPDGDDTFLHMVEKNNNINVIKISNKGFIPLRFTLFDYILLLPGIILNVIKIKKNIKTKKIDLIIANSISSLLGCLIGYFNKIPVISIIHEEISPTFIKFIYFKILNRLSCKIIFISKYTAQNYCKDYNSNEKIRVMYLGLLPYITKKNNVRRYLSGNLNKKNQFIIGTIGNVTPVKGIEYLAEAAFYLKNKIDDSDYKFQIIGDTKNIVYFKYINNTLKKNGLMDKFEFVGFRENPSDYLDQFDIFVLPSIQEGLPLVLIEAMLARKPIIASRVGGVPELINNEENGILIEPRNSKALAEAIIKLKNEKDKRQLFSNKSYAKVSALINQNKDILKAFDSI